MLYSSLYLWSYLGGKNKTYYCIYVEWFSCIVMYTFKMSCSGQRVVVQEKNEDKVVEHVVTIQVWQMETVSPDLLKIWIVLRSSLHLI